jgi:hypothetical protein
LFLVFIIIIAMLVFGGKPAAPSVIPVSAYGL